MKNIAMERTHVPNCFGCSPDNPTGLRAVFSQQDDCVIGEFVSSGGHAGPPGIVHGGVIAALIDESFSQLTRGLLKKDARTIRVEISFRNPARLGERLRVETRLIEEKNRAFFVTSRVCSPDDTVIAEATGTLYKTAP